MVFNLDKLLLVYGIILILIFSKFLICLNVSILLRLYSRFKKSYYYFSKIYDFKKKSFLKQLIKVVSSITNN